MDLKELDNYQLVLLTLLVSFVTSIATGIITVYLLQQSPTVSSVINQVIERTIEKTVPSTGTTPVLSQPSPTQTIIIKEDDLVAEALAQGFKEVGGIYTVITVNEPSNASDTLPTSGEQTVLVSEGVLIDTKGTFVTSGSYTAKPTDYVLISGNKYPIATSTYTKEADLTVLTLTQGEKTQPFADFKSEGVGTIPKVGQTALVIGLNGKFIKTTISQVNPPAKDAPKGTGSQIVIQDALGTKWDGAPVLSSEGTIIGIVAIDSEGVMRVYASDSVRNALATPPAAVPSAK